MYDGVPHSGDSLQMLIGLYKFYNYVFSEDVKHPFIMYLHFQIFQQKSNQFYRHVFLMSLDLLLRCASDVYYLHHRPCWFLDDLEILTNWPTRLVVPAVHRRRRGSWDHLPSLNSERQSTVNTRFCYTYSSFLSAWPDDAPLLRDASWTMDYGQVDGCRCTRGKN